MTIDPLFEQELQHVTALSDSEPKFGSVIARNGTILNTGFAHKSTDQNLVKDHPLLLIHAEEAALLEALRKNLDISGADIYVLGIRESGETRYSDHSYSCVVCSRLLKQSGLSHIVYPTPDGWEKITVDEMFLRAIRRVQEGII
jgi:deoxycytidylate deaminase